MNIDTLLKLQAEDSRIRLLQHEYDVVIPARRADAKKRLKAARDAVERAEQDNLAAIKEYTRFQHDYTASRNQMFNAERRGAAQTNARGVNAAVAEYDAAAENAARAAENAERAYAARTPTERRLDAARAYEADEDIAVQKILETLDARKAAIKEELAQLQAVAAEIATEVEPRLLKLYNRVKLTRWPAVAELNRTSSVCAGCDIVQPIAIKQELVAEEKHPTGKLLCCPCCGRILY